MSDTRHAQASVADSSLSSPMLDNPYLQEKYRIEKLIGNGSFSTVYRALELRCHRRVAIKALRRDAYEQGNSRYASSEIGAMGRIWQHPNIVSIHTVEPGDDEHLAYIVMEYIEGGSLKRLMQGSRMPLEQALVLTYDICSGLAYAHRQNVIHRDIKPRNILLTRQEIAKVSDFGVAQVREVAHDYASTFAGTRRYMAPEQYDDVYDHRVDVFAVGILLWEMLLGSFPYEGETQEELRHAKRTCVPQPPASLPEPVREILMMSLRPEPHERFRDMDQMRDAVGRVLEVEYERLVMERVAAGFSAPLLDSGMAEKREALRIPASTAQYMEQLVLGRHQEHLRLRAAEETAESAARHAETLAVHVCKRNFDLAFLELEQLAALEALPRPVTELIEMLCRQIQGAVEIAHPMPPRMSGTELIKRVQKEAKAHVSAGDKEKAAALWRATGIELEQEKHWRKARSAYQRSAAGYAQLAQGFRAQGETMSAARFFQKAGESSEHARDRRKALVAYSRAAECWCAVAQKLQEANELVSAAEAYRAAAHAYDQAKNNPQARELYRAAALLFYDGARRSLSEGAVGEAESFCRLAFDLSTSIGGWEITEEARRVLEHIRHLRGTEAMSTLGDSV